jgi:predicted O-methyltransferase YrrM
VLPLIKSQLKKYKAGWEKSFMEGFSQDEHGNALPWMTYTFIEYISQKLTKEHEIFEFGCGASTLFFAPKVKKIVVIESNAMWLRIMKEKLEEAGINNVEIIFIEDGFINKAYENSAKNYARIFGQKFDFIFIDSLKRFECLKKSIPALKPSGMLVLDDSERKSYKKIFKFFAEKNFQKEDFFGIAPGQFYLKNTTTFWKD